MSCCLARAGFGCGAAEIGGLTAPRFTNCASAIERLPIGSANGLAHPVVQTGATLAVDAEKSTGGELIIAVIAELTDAVWIPDSAGWLPGSTLTIDAGSPKAI